MPRPTVSADTEWVVESLCPSQMILKSPEGPAAMNCWAVALGEAKWIAFGESSQILLLPLQRLHCEHGQGRLLRARPDLHRGTGDLEVGGARIRKGSVPGNG